jgi:O-antigen/teichoic acid export membrane protein
LAAINLQSSFAKASVTLFSRIITALVGIIFVPVYVRLIGAESYGLVAFFSTLIGSLAILDLGLSMAISRQVAILRVQEGKVKEMKDLVYSVAVIYWAIAITIGLVIIALARPISIYWVNAKDLPVPVIEKAVILMGIVFAFQFPSSIYNGVMAGLEKQVPNAIITVLFTLLKAIGVILVLKFVSATIGTYFIWQAITTLLFTLALHLFVWKGFSVNKGKAVFSKLQLKTIWRFAVGMTGISAVTFFISQIDKIVVSKMVLLEFVGYYNLAFMVSGVMNQLVSPLQPVIFPKFAALVAQHKQAELIRVYHKSCRWIAIIIFPIGFTLLVFAKEILLLWTRDPVLTKYTAPILQVCAAGTICNCMMWVPYFFMLAKGITRFIIYQNLIASVILVPLLFWWTGKYGAIGASFVWLSINAGYVLITLPVFHKLYLKGEMWKWIKNDIGLPCIAAGLLVAGAKYFQIQTQPDINRTTFGAMLIILLIIYILIIPEIRALATRLKWQFKL